jgi:hypothetical protein
MCYILYTIVGPPIRGFRGISPKNKLGVYLPNLWAVFCFLWGQFFTFGSLATHGISARGFLLLVKELSL